MEEEHMSFLGNGKWLRLCNSLLTKQLNRQKEYLRNLITMPERKYEFVSLQKNVKSCFLLRGSNGLWGFSPFNFPAKDFNNLARSLRKHAVTDYPASTSLIPTFSFCDVSSSSGRKDMRPADRFPHNVDSSFTPTKTIEDEWSVKPLKKDDVDILESIVQIKEAEARMIQSLANDALGEVGSLRRLTRPKSEILEEEYSE